MLTYTEFYDGTTTKGVFRSTLARSGVTPLGPSGGRAQTPARTLAPSTYATPSEEVIIVDGRPTMHSPSPLVARSREGCYAPYVGPHFNIRSKLYEVGSDAETYEQWEPCSRLKGFI